MTRSPPPPRGRRGQGAGARRVRLRVWVGAWLLAALALLPWSISAWDVDRMQAEAARHGQRAVAGVRALQGLHAELQALDELAKLRGVNDFFNRRVLFRDDAEVWGQVDYWSSPMELLEKGAGDCEDYATAKYFVLLNLGVPMAKLRLVYVRAQLGGTAQAHMVLAYYESPGAEPLILDNLAGEVRPASRRPDLAPVFSFNGEGLWQGVGAQAAGGDPVSRLSRWRELLAKARAEGFL